jgi:hypothetical protein
MLTKSKIAFPLAVVLCAASVPLATFVIGSVSIAHAGQAGAGGQRMQGNGAQDYAMVPSGPYVAPKSSGRAQQAPSMRPFTWFEKRWFDYQDQD